MPRDTRGEPRIDCGIVWRAARLGLDRLVAIKLPTFRLPTGLALSPHRPSRWPRPRAPMKMQPSEAVLQPEFQAFRGRHSRLQAPATHDNRRRAPGVGHGRGTMPDRGNDRSGCRGVCRRVEDSVRSSRRFGRSERHLFQLDHRRRTGRATGQGDRPGARSEGPDGTPPEVHQTAVRPLACQQLAETIDGVALGDAAEIDRHRRPGQRCLRRCRQQSAAAAFGLSMGRWRNPGASSAPLEDLRSKGDIEGPRGLEAHPIRQSQQSGQVGGDRPKSRTGHGVEPREFGVVSPVAELLLQPVGFAEGSLQQPGLVSSILPADRDFQQSPHGLATLPAHVRPLRAGGLSGQSSGGDARPHRGQKQYRPRSTGPAHR